MINVVCYIALAILSYACVSAEVHPLSEEYINLINTKQSLWKAGKNFDPDTPLSSLQDLLGVRKHSTEGIHRVRPTKNKDTVIPRSFDAREQWSKCASIKEIFDQSSCGSCWAVSTASAMSDRLCIRSNETTQTLVSAKNLMSCCTQCGNGCEGGWPYIAWAYWIVEGIVSGGAYNSSVGCQSYPFISCEHHGTSGSRPPCGKIYETPACAKVCDEGASLSYNHSLTFGESSYLIEKGVEPMQLDIMTNGPVISDFDVYADLFSYKSGIYKHTSNGSLGRHAVRVIGWGAENDVPYWLVANSWNTDWGDKGTFKILRGANECGFEEEVTGGIPKI